MKTIYPPEQPDLSGFTVFLAGTIDNGNSVNWQEQFIEKFEGKNITFLNPRRKEWDSTWKQDKNNPQFREQVEWELDGIDGMESADLVVMYLAPGSLSPISLFELGVLTKSPEKVILYCPDGFWRKGNVDVAADRYKFTSVSSFEEIISIIEKIITKL